MPPSLFKQPRKDKGRVRHASVVRDHSEPEEKLGVTRGQERSCGGGGGGQLIHRRRQKGNLEMQTTLT